MLVHERKIGDREVSLEVWDDVWTVVVTRGVDVLILEEFDDQLEAQKAYRGVK